MKDLIAALTILMGYAENDNSHCPTHCEHDILLVSPEIDHEKVSDSDKEKLKKLGFFVSKEFNCFGSFRFGSA
jgi:hypothetical protein